MTLMQLWQIIWTGRWRLILGTLACIAGTLVISLRLPKAYEARARVLLEVVGADPVTGVVIGTKQIQTYITTQVLLVGSDRVGELAIDKLGWATNPTVIESWREQTGGVGNIRTWAAQRLLSEVSARPLEGGGVLEISYRAPGPDAAREITRTLREAYIETMLSLQTDAAQRRAKRYETLAAQARKALEAAQAELTRVQRETGIVVDATGKDIEGRGLGMLQDAASDTAELARRDANRAAVTAGIAQAEMVRRKLITLEQAIALAAATKGTDNLDYKTLLDQRAALSGQLTAAAAAARSQAAAAIAASRVMAAQPETDYLRERERVLGLGPERIKVDQAVRIVELRRGEFNRLQTNLADARQSAARTESGLVVMGDVISGSAPVSPNVTLNVVIATLFGFILTLASVLIDGLSRREVLSEADLVAASGVPVLAVMPGDRPSRLRWLRWLRRPRWPRQRRANSLPSVPATA